MKNETFAEVDETYLIFFCVLDTTEFIQARKSLNVHIALANDLLNPMDELYTLEVITKTFGKAAKFVKFVALK